jgi:putative nucleotidyltransferase with HDIG domain
MTSAPRLVTRALVASFTTVAIILVAVFVLISLDVRQRVRESVAANLASGQQAFARVERIRRQDLLATVSVLAESPTLKAALDIWQTEREANAGSQAALIATVQRELAKIAAQIDADALAVLDAAGEVVASAGPRASAWPEGTALRSRDAEFEPGEFLVRLETGTFRVMGVPLQVGGAIIGSLDVGRAVDRRYAGELAELARAESAILVDGEVAATTLTAEKARELAEAGANVSAAGTVTLAGESFAVRPVEIVGPAAILTLAPIDAAAASATRAALTDLAWIGAAALMIAGAASFWLAHAMTRPIDQLSASMTAMMVARRFDTPLPATGKSRELDALAATFNKLIRAVAEAEAQTQAAYLGAIRALAAALDARDPYTAGHSERVSALAVEMGKAMAIGEHDLDVLRLGALLHDVGKIGIPDEVLGKPSSLTPDEFELIRAHPVIGARILRSIPFLAPHLPIVELHHERPDGRGYPYGLVGEAIPRAARIVHVADAYDAMTSARAYRPARLPQDAIAELRQGVGTDFDGEAVQALIDVLPRLPVLSASFEREPLALRRPLDRSAT